MKFHVDGVVGWLVEVGEKSKKRNMQEVNEKPEATTS
jgi:hypothetical protein